VPILGFFHPLTFVLPLKLVNCWVSAEFFHVSIDTVYRIESNKQFKLTCLDYRVILVKALGRVSLKQFQAMDLVNELGSPSSRRTMRAYLTSATSEKRLDE